VESSHNAEVPVRTVFAVALCFVLGACATSGGGEPDIYGVWHPVSENGIAVPTDGANGLLLSFGPDGVVESFVRIPTGEGGAMTGSYSLGEAADGCRSIELVFENVPASVLGSICGEVLTLTGESTFVFHKGR